MENHSVTQISNEKAAAVQAGRLSKPPVIYYLINNNLVSMQAKIAADLKASMVGKRTQTKLKIMLKLNDMGKWETFKTVLSSMPQIVQDAWNLAQEISEQDPLFVANKDAFLAALGITVEQFWSLFD